MPYATNADLNDEVKKTYKSEHQRTAFRKAFNAAMSEYKDEGTAFAVAHKAAKSAKESFDLVTHEREQLVEYSDGQPRNEKGEWEAEDSSIDASVKQDRDEKTRRALERARKIQAVRKDKISREASMNIEHNIEEVMSLTNLSVQERQFSAEQRDKAAKSGAAMPDGSFPIQNKKDLENAIQAIGRAKNPAKAKAHIKARAKALGCTDCIPDTWESWDFVAKDGTLYEEAFVASDSHDGLRQQLSSAIDGKVQAGCDMDGDDDGAEDAVERKNAGYPLHYVQQVHDNHVIYSMGGKNFAHKYEKDAEGDVQLKGEPQEVEHSFTPVKSKESFAESFAFDVVESGKKAEMISESYGDSGEITFTMIKPGLSKNNRYYSPDMLKRDYRVFEGAKMFVNHQTDKEASTRPEGDLRDWAANVTKVWPEADGTIKAKAIVINPTIKETLKNLAGAGQLHTMGVSIRAMGEASDGVVDGKKCKVIEGIKAAKSVDFVTFPGAGGAVESLQ